MGRKKWLNLLAVGILVLVSALTVAIKRAAQAPVETRGRSLDYLARVYGIIDRFIGVPFRRLTVRLARVTEGDAVLDIGCATGTLTLLEKEKASATGYVAGIDIGPRLIARAQARAAQSKLDVDYRVASIDALPFPGETFDVATSSLMVHHLPAEVKLAGFREVHRVLKPGGRYLIVDFPAARGLLGQLRLAIARLFARVSEEASFSLDLLEGKVLEMLRQAGFTEVESLGRYRLAWFFPVSFIVATKARAKPE